MSFTSIVKNEISKIDSNEMEYIAELSALFRTLVLLIKLSKLYRKMLVLHVEFLT